MSVSSQGAETASFRRDGDVALWRDLMAKARNNPNIAHKWVNDLGIGTPTENSAGELTARAQGKGNSEGVQAFLRREVGQHSAFQYLAGLQHAFDLAAAEAGAPADFYCPISFRVFRDPVTVPTGQTYERPYLEKWLALGNHTCPATGQRLERPISVTPNHTLRKAIEEWCRTHVTWILDINGHLKPIELEEERLYATRLAHLDQDGNMEDLAMAIRLQEEAVENSLARSHAQQRSNINRRRGCQACSVLNFMLLACTLGCIAVFILSLWQGGWNIENLSANPLIGPNATALSRLGSIVSQKILDQNQWWRIISSVFVSSGVIHLFSAITSLWTLAKYLEYSGSIVMPSLSIPAVYLVSGVTGAVASAAFAFEYDSTGATSGIGGLLGAVWMEQIVNFQRYRNHLATLVVLGLLTAMFIVLSLLPLVGLWYQVVSMASGALLLPVILAPRQTQGSERRRRRLRSCLAWALKCVCVSIIVGVLVVGILSVLINDASIARSCHFCQTVDCVDTRWWKCAAVQPLQAQASCKFEAASDTTTSITCPSGSVQVVDSGSIGDRIAACNSACSTVATFAPPAASPNSAGVLI